MFPPQLSWSLGIQVWLQESPLCCPFSRKVPGAPESFGEIPIHPPQWAGGPYKAQSPAPFRWEETHRLRGGLEQHSFPPRGQSQALPSQSRSAHRTPSSTLGSCASDFLQTALQGDKRGHPTAAESPRGAAGTQERSGGSVRIRPPKQGAQAPSLVGEPRCHISAGTAKNKHINMVFF